MPDLLISIGLILIGAVVGAVMTYFASYVLEKKKWTIEATLRRKEQIYGPIYDELRLKQDALASFESWVRATGMRQNLDAWARIRETQLALEIPTSLKQRLEFLSDTFETYSKRTGDFFEEARAAFPGRHEGFDDYGVAIVLSKKMLVAPTRSNQAAIDYLDSQRTITRNGADYWTPDNLRDLEASISNLSSWQPLVESHNALKESIDSLEKEMEQRIERIVKKIYPPDSSL
jgi:hypothetical protein